MLTDRVRESPIFALMALRAHVLSGIPVALLTAPTGVIHGTSPRDGSILVTGARVAAERSGGQRLNCRFVPSQPTGAGAPESPSECSSPMAGSSDWTGAATYGSPRTSRHVCTPSGSMIGSASRARIATALTSRAVPTPAYGQFEPAGLAVAKDPNRSLVIRHAPLIRATAVGRGFRRDPRRAGGRSPRMRPPRAP